MQILRKERESGYKRSRKKNAEHQMLIGGRYKRQHVFWYARSYFISTHSTKSEPRILYPQCVLSHKGESDICLPRSVISLKELLVFLSD